MKTRILALVLMMIFVAGVTTAQGVLPMNYESVVLKGSSGENEHLISTFYRVRADGQVDSKPFVVPGKKRLMITEFSVWGIGAPDGKVVELAVDGESMVYVPKTEQLLNINMNTGFAVAPSAKLQARIYDIYGSWNIILRGYLTLSPWSSPR